LILSKKDEFKTFVSTHPNLVSIVKDKTHTWQDLYEVYDLYGNDDALWDKYLSNSTKSASEAKLDSLGELTKLFKNVNIDNVQKYIDTAQKAIGVIQELTGAKAVDEVIKGPSVSRPINKIFED
jgi:hypothetical protein